MPEQRIMKKRKENFGDGKQCNISHVYFWYDKITSIACFVTYIFLYMEAAFGAQCSKTDYGDVLELVNHASEIVHFPPIRHQQYMDNTAITIKRIIFYLFLSVTVSISLSPPIFLFLRLSSFPPFTYSF